MQPKPSKYLFDIHDAGEFILTITRDMTLEQFLANRLVRDAAERNFITIGEAINQLGESDAQLEKQIDPTGKIVAFRNVVVHGYHSLDYTRVWAVIQAHLNPLMQQVAELLKEQKPE